MHQHTKILLKLVQIMIFYIFQMPIRNHVEFLKGGGLEDRGNCPNWSIYSGDIVIFDFSGCRCHHLRF